MGKLTAEWCDFWAGAWEDEADESRATGRAAEAPGDMAIAHVYRIAAATLRWYAKTETGGDDHAERQAMIAACKEATSERA